jgi:hypothetical protein
MASIIPAVPHGLSHSFRRRAKTVAVVIGFAIPVEVVLEVPLAFFVYTAARSVCRARTNPTRKLPRFAELFVVDLHVLCRTCGIVTT